MPGRGVIPSGGDRPRWDLPRVLLVAGVLVAIAAIVTWVGVGGGHGGNGSEDANGGNCRLPAAAHPGTEPLPALISELTAPLGTPDVTFTETSGAHTVYAYCYDVVDGSAVAAALHLLRSQPYDAAPGNSPTQQINFTKHGLVPAGVSLTVTGDLDAGHPVAGTTGGLSIVWTDTDPGD